MTARRLAVWVLGALLVATIVLGTLDALVWAPMALAPNIPLPRIYEVLAERDDLSYALITFLLWPVFWSAITLVYLMLLVPLRPRFATVARTATPLVAASIGLVTLGVAVFFQWWSEFGMAMSVSDDLPPYEGSMSPFGLVYLAVGFIAGVLGTIGLLAAAVRARRATRVPAQA